MTEQPSEDVIRAKISAILEHLDGLQMSDGMRCLVAVQAGIIEAMSDDNHKRSHNMLVCFNQLQAALQEEPSDGE